MPVRYRCAAGQAVTRVVAGARQQRGSMRRRARVIAFAVVAVGVLALPAVSGARTQLVWAGGPIGFQHTLRQRYSAVAHDFFPRQVVINRGDTIRWQGMSINFHSIDLPGTSGHDLPLDVPTGSKTGGVSDAAGNPFWFDGQPNVGVNLGLFEFPGQTYDGSTRVDSGLPIGKPKPFAVTFTKPGRYVYFCDVHYDMRGIIVVLPTGERTPSVAQNAARVARQVARDEQVARALAKTTVRGDKVSLGLAGKDNVERLAMLPATLHVRAGTTVSFQMSPLTGETHTATFGPAGYLTALLATRGRAVLDPRTFYPSSPTSPIRLDPTTDGNGFANTGHLDRDPGTPLPPGRTITFTKPGVYHYLCVIHPFMRGTVIVS